MKEVPEALAHAYNEAAKAEAAWKKEKDKIGEAIRELAGEETDLAVQGVKVFTYEYIDGFRGKDFAKENPELVEQFTDWESKRVIKVDTIKKLQPDLYRRYQQRQFRIVND